MTSTATTQPHDVLSAKEAAEYLGVAYSTLSGWRWTNVGPRYMRVGNSRRARVRYYRSDLDDFLAAGVVTPDGAVSANGLR